MNLRMSIDRRRFLKSTALATGGLIHAGSGQAATTTHRPPLLSADAQGVSGLLFSQVGYELDQPVRVVMRLPQRDLLPNGVVCLLSPLDTEQAHQTPCQYWGEVWGSHWWVAEFAPLRETGTWHVAVKDDSQTFAEATGLRVEKDILWNETVELSSVDILERRLHFTKVGAGWQDAGALWVESPAQSAMIIGLTELLEQTGDQLDQNFTARIYQQLTVGCDYLVITQEKAEELGFPSGAMSHDVLGHEKDVLPHDAAKAIVALLRSARHLPEAYREQAQRYRATARRAYDWLFATATPMGDYGFSRSQRGLPEDTPVPADEWQTRNLLTMCQAALEMHQDGDSEAQATALEYARRLMDRQITQDQAEEGYYGHFREYDSLPHSETAWSHGIISTPEGSQFGSDMGGIYPNYLMPLLDMLQRWPDHADAGQWQETLRRFTYGYLIPVCQKNPFYLLPLGVFKGEGPIWFCGPFHGTNTVYGYTAALALALAKHLDEPRLIPIAYGNLQWIAGLNGGITRENIKQGCVIFSTEVPEGVALPASMICGVGQRWAGTWFQTRGVICNGFSTGEQFKYDVAPKKENDGPFSFTDEDWIPHSAAWITGLTRLKQLS